MNYLANYYHKDIQKLISKVKGNLNKTIVIEGNNDLKKVKTKFDLIILKNSTAYVDDVQTLFKKIKKIMTPSARILIIYYNPLWEPLLNLASILGWRKKVSPQNWLDQNDISNLLQLTDYEIITSQKRLLLPINIDLISDFVNKFIAHLPIINSLCLTTWVVAKQKIPKWRDYSISIIIPARNEERNIPKIIPSIPKFGKWQEIIFVEGHSRDKTWEKIQEEVKRKKRRKPKVKAFKQKGLGKADAVRLGFSKAQGDILIIYDADRTVDAKDLIKFYDILSSGKGDFVNGSRLVYPMEKDAMRTLNKIGNEIFSWIFTWILGQKFKDTLCGTKAMFKKDYEIITKNRRSFRKVDPFGDFDLIFGAVESNLKIIELPVRYKQRLYGSTNISRIKHGLLLAKMTLSAFQQFRAY